MMTNKIKYKSEIILLIVALLWSGTFAIIKDAINDISPMAFVAIRFGIAGIILLPFMKDKVFTKQNILAGVFLGTLLCVEFATQTFGLKFTTATKSGFLTGTAVIMVPLMQVMIKKRKPTKGVLIGTVLVLIGLSFLSSSGSSILNLFNDIGSNVNLGDALNLTSALFFELYIIYLDIETLKHDFWVLLFLQFVTTAFLSGISLFVFSVTNLEPVKIELSRNLIFAIVYTSIFATLIATALQTKFQKDVTPTKAVIIFSFEPIFAALFAFIMLGEKISSFGYLGATLIILGLLISELYENLLMKKR
ncbi:MAG: DMT family transporter [Chitinophagaceae bacterium]|nr:DMT family transporter [Chitinophagaceae bacterium]